MTAFRRPRSHEVVTFASNSCAPTRTSIGLVEPFTPTLRRRCVEMVAYLALHRHEPVTGERLRTRVLTHADVDASQRTLANTASAVRRSLGVDVARSPTPPGHVVGPLRDPRPLERRRALLYPRRAGPTLRVADAAPLAHEALLLIKGEPLASALRGFEWFLAEGHGARLARDGEWAALALHHTSMQRRNYELAFWALQQGLLIDPYSDALAEALTRVPRLREFGGDGARRAQNAARRPRPRCSDELVVRGPQPAGLAVARGTRAAGRRRGTWRAIRESC